MAAQNNRDALVYQLHCHHQLGKGLEILAGDFHLPLVQLVGLETWLQCEPRDYEQSFPWLVPGHPDSVAGGSSL